MMEGTSTASFTAAKMALGALSVAAASMFTAMRDCIGRERARQASVREREGLPKSAKIAYVPQSMSDKEEAEVSMASSTISAMFGDGPSQYACDKLKSAIASGDMRAFKIRLLFLKARDSLKGTPAYGYFSMLVDDAIAKSEELAGCRPDPSPRRMSKTEKARRERLDRRRKELESANGVQQELPLEWPSSDNQKTVEDNSPHQDIDIVDCNGLCDSVCPKSQTVCKNGKDPLKNEFDPKHTPCYPQGIGNGEKQYDSHSESEHIENDGNEILGIAGDHKRYSNAGGSDSAKNLANIGVVRKAREYESVEQILDDIDSGKIVPYESSSQICEDMKKGMLTPVEAFMFTAAISRLGHDEADSDADLEREYGAEFQGDDAGNDVLEDEDDEEDDFDYDDGDRGGRSGRSNFSYNPNGFYGGVAGEGWDRDEDW